MDASQTFGCCDLGFDYSIKVSVTEELASSVNWLETALSGEVDKTADKKQTELSSVEVSKTAQILPTVQRSPQGHSPSEQSIN